MAKINDVIVPEVFTDTITEKVKGKIRLSSLATEIGTLKNSNEGDSITFPCFKSIGEAELMEKGVALTPEVLNQTSLKKVVRHFGKSVKVYDHDEITAVGRFAENAADQIATVIARGKDKDLADDIKTNAVLKVTTDEADKITEDNLIEGFQLFGDEQDSSDFSAIVINSKLVPSFYNMEGFSDRKYAYNPTNNGNEIVDGVIGTYRNIPIMMTDIGTYDTTLKECVTFLVKKNALAIMPKQDFELEFQRDGNMKATDVIGDTYSAQGLVDLTGVVVIRKTIA